MFEQCGAASLVQPHERAVQKVPKILRQGFCRRCFINLCQPSGILRLAEGGLADFEFQTLTWSCRSYGCVTVSLSLEGPSATADGGKLSPPNMTLYPNQHKIVGIRSSARFPPPTIPSWSPTLCLNPASFGPSPSSHVMLQSRQ